MSGENQFDERSFFSFNTAKENAFLSWIFSKSINKNAPALLPCNVYKVDEQT